MNKATVHELLDDPRVWRARRGNERRPTLSSGYPELDVLLPGGGWPAGRLTEIAVERWGSGELALLIPLLVRLSAEEAPAERHWIAWISPPFLPYAPALAAAGMNIGRMLLVRTGDDTSTLWAAEQALRSCSCRLVLAWSARVGAAGLRRLQLAAEAGGTTLILFRPPAALAAPSVAALRLSLAGGRGGAQLRLIKHRGSAPETVSLATLQGQ